MNEVVGNKFCSECGNSLIATAVICPKCGSPTARFGQYVGQNAGVNRSNSAGYASQPKSKSVAVVLAVFLGLWSYLYTYKKDAGLFWANLVVAIVIAFTSASTGDEGVLYFVAILSAVVAIIVQASRTPEWFLRYPNN